MNFNKNSYIYYKFDKDLFHLTILNFDILLSQDDKSLVNRKAMSID